MASVQVSKAGSLLCVSVCASAFFYYIACSLFNLFRSNIIMKYVIWFFLFCTTTTTTKKNPYTHYSYCNDFMMCNWRKVLLLLFLLLIMLLLLSFSSFLQISAKKKRIAWRQATRLIIDACAWFVKLNDNGRVCVWSHTFFSASKPTECVTHKYDDSFAPRILFARNDTHKCYTI